MKRLSTIFILFVATIFSQQACAFDLLDHYFNAPANGGTLHYDTVYGYGDTSHGSDFDLCDNYSSTRKPGDKITAITTYSGKEKIKGIKIEYLYAGDETVGATGGSGYRKTLGNTEYIQGFRFYKKRDGNISRIKVYLKDMSNNSTRDILFGDGNGWYKWQETHLSVQTRSVVGFAGTANSSTIWSIYPCVADRLELEEVDVEIHWNQIAETEGYETYFGESLLLNSSSTTQSASSEVSYSYGARASDTWTNTLGVSVTAGVSLTQGYKVGVPSTIENSGSITFSFSETFSASTTVGQASEENEQTTMKQTISGDVPAYTVLLARMQVDYAAVEVPYTSTVINPHNGEEYQFQGVISGSDYSNAVKQWDEVGKVYGTSYEIYESYEWVIDYYNLQNATVIADPF